MKRYFILIMIAFTAVSFTMCSFFKPAASEYSVDPVCNKKVDQRDAYTCDYDSKKYYFDSYNCKEVFRQSPQTYLNKKNCDTK